MATCYDRYRRVYYTCNSRWHDWGRWVALAVILIIAFLIFFLCACLSQRRRRRAGRQPFYGTGWTTKLPGGGGVYNPPQNYQPPPSYNQYENTGAPAGGYYGQGSNPNYYGGQNASYFGGQRDIEVQRPDNVYSSNNTYAPPPGPPPSKVA